MVKYRMITKFQRRLRKVGIDYLETQPAWWQDLLNLRFTDASGTTQSVFLAIRDNYLNAYVEGQSILKIGFGAGNRTAKVSGRIHHKYVHDDAQGQKLLVFDGDHIDNKPYSRVLLERAMTRAQGFAGKEKKSIAVSLGRNSTIIDTEMALPANPGFKVADRIDIVALEKTAKGLAIVFYEAKHLGNHASLRSNNTPAVLDQLRRYQRWINTADRASEVAAAYRSTCRLLMNLDPMQNRETHPFVREAADGAPLHVDRVPRLVVFGDAETQPTASWSKHKEVLANSEFPLHVVLQPEDFTLPPDDSQT